MMRRFFFCLSVNRIPFVLCGSRYAPILNYMELRSRGSKRTFPRASLFSLTAGGEDMGAASSDNAASEKKQKKQAFDALVHWCAAHQQAATRAFPLGGTSSTMTVSACLPSSLECDEAVLRWLQEHSDTLTCGQSLLVCSFVCEVLLCRLDAAAASVAEAAAGSRWGGVETGTDLSLQQQVSTFTNRIVALLKRANRSDKLELQPLSVLTSCAYGVHRLSCVESPFFGEAEKLLLKLPSAVMFAILHQLRSDGLRKLSQLEEQLTINVCLTLLLIVDEERRQAFLPVGDTVIVNAVLRRLLRHAAQLVKKVDEASEESFLALANNASSTDFSPLPCVGQGEVANSPSMQECVAIMQNIAFSSPTSRLEMLSYLLRIRKKPAHYTRSELQLLPALLQTVSNVRLPEARVLETKIIAEVPIPDDDPVLVAQLFSFTASKEARYLVCLDAVAAEGLTAKAAVDIIGCAGVYLRWETLQRLTAVVLEKEARSTSPSSSPLNSRLALNGAMECILTTFVTRLADLTLSAERDAIHTYLGQLVERVDWAGSTPPESAKLALERITLLKKLSDCGFHVRAPDAVMALGEKALDLESGSSMINTLQCVIEALSLLSEVERRRDLVVCMIRYNGTRSTSSAIRFVALLAPLAVAHGVCNSELVQLLLKMQTLNPFKLRQGYIEGLLSVEDAFTVFVIHAVNYLLASEEWRTSTDRIREAVTLWLQEYLHHLMQLSRKQKMASITAHNDGKGEASPPHGEGGDLEATVTEVPGPERLEELFSLLLRAGVKLPDYFASELTARVRDIETAGAPAGEGRGRLHFPLPGHFVFCCKLDIAMDSPFSMELLEYLLTTCDCRILHFVITAFLVHAKATSRDPHILLLANLRLVFQTLKLFLRRLDALGDDLLTAFFPSSAPSVVANSVRFIVGFLTKQERNQRVLKSLRGAHSTEEEKDGSRQPCGTPS
ncbi:hypothetical protein TRSC58_01382 [Trypanosoma rangeli SC58]|uniref:Uncharacterized protein n=1 Tax=Trypanosoma rangeli SC58 TaxID=429131 RepID=A0A061JC65_TRYRA|nr:hypothetical protein TRSC58_01382 [Trypanosoma rangeli SC58]